MLQSFYDFKVLSHKKEIKMANSKFDKIVQKFNFFHFEKNDVVDEQLIQSINKSKVIIINSYLYGAEEHIVVCFEGSLIIFSKSNQTIIKAIFSRNNEDKVFFIPKIKICQHNYSESKQIITKTTIFQVEIEAFIRHFDISKKHSKSVRDFWDIIKVPISAYLIKKSYGKTYNDRITNFKEAIENPTKPKIYKKDDFIKLIKICVTDSSQIKLLYHIEDEQLIVEKSIYNEIDKLKSREIGNYKKINHPLTPIYYGQIEGGKSFLIEFINGKTLTDLHKYNLSLKQKLLILIQILYVFQYLHQKQLIYRDLKPNNLIFDFNNRIVLIDFDRMIDINEESYTHDFNLQFADPKMMSDGFSFKNDVYSIGQMISYILNNNIFKFINEIIGKCTSKESDQRPSISSIISYLNRYVSGLFHNFDIELSIFEIVNNFSFYKNQMDPSTQNKLGLFYYECGRIKNDVNEALYYLTLASNQKYQEAQYNLGVIYYEGKYIKRDVNKAIYYLVLAANQNNINAQYKLANIYYEGKHVVQDVNKTIRYLTLTANQNHLNARKQLGNMYLNSNSSIYDIEKAVYYFKLASDQNDSESQFNLGLFYYEGKHTAIDIKRAIHYFSLAANQNNANAQYQLGMIFYLGKYTKTDINKAIHYLSLASNHNNSNALYKLGKIYRAGKFVKIDIPLAIKYFLLAAKLNNPKAQNRLGVIYYKGHFIPRDIEKATYYFTLASNQNYAIAQFNLAYIYYTGKGSKFDIKMAIRLLERSAILNNFWALKTLLQIYGKGRYIEQDSQKAFYYQKLFIKMIDDVLKKKIKCIVSSDKYLMEAFIAGLEKCISDDSNAMFEYLLGVMHYENKYIPRNIDEAIKHFTAAANYNYLKAQVELGVIYYQSHYVKPDIPKAIHYFSLAANQNNANAQYQLGMIFYLGKYTKTDINKAIHYLSLASNHNNSNALYKLGKIYRAGKFVKIDIPLAIKYFLLAAKLNNPKAQNRLGVIYYKGHFIPRDIEKATYYFTLASNQNYAIAQFNLAYIYYTGKGSKFDIKMAIRLLERSAILNNFWALKTLLQIYGKGRYIEQDSQKAFYYQKLFIKMIDDVLKKKIKCIVSSDKYLMEAFIAGLEKCISDDSNAMFEYLLGVMHYENKYIPRNIDEAIKHFTAAANYNYLKAQVELGVIYYQSHYVKQDIPKAIHYLTLAANQNSSEAHCHLGIIYSCIKHDIRKAIHYLKLSCQPFAYYNLGLIYYKGKGVPKDMAKSIHYLTLAANKNYSDAQVSLAIIYLYDTKNKNDTKKAIHYLTLASKNNHPLGQFLLGRYYFNQGYINKGKRYLNYSSQNEYYEANIFLGDLYLEGKYFKRDIKKSISLYKKASNNYNSHAKNNLGIIYKHGFEGIGKNLILAKEYFEEAIRYENNSVSMYNLANLLIDENENDHEYSKPIKLLIDSASQYYYPSIEFLILLLFKKYEMFDLEILQIELKINNKQSKKLEMTIYEKFLSLFQKICNDADYFEFIYHHYRKLEYVYIDKFIYSFQFIENFYFPIMNTKTNTNMVEINHLFYEGLGNDIFVQENEN